MRIERSKNTIWKKPKKKLPKLRCKGTLAELQQLVFQTGVEGIWLERNSGSHQQFVSSSGTVMNWWPSTGTIHFNGKGGDEHRHLRCKLLELGSTGAGSCKVYIVGPTRPARTVGKYDGHSDPEALLDQPADWTKS